MRRFSSLILAAVLAAPFALAGGRYYGKSSGWYSVLMLLVFILGTFIFSVIFWWTYLWIVEDKGKLGKE